MLQKYIYVKMLMQKKLQERKEKTVQCLSAAHEGIDGILVTVGLCIIALVLCVFMKDKLGEFIETIVSSMTTKATQILGTPLV